MFAKIESLCPLAGRVILGLYFLLPGAVLKIVNAALIVGYKTQIAAFLLAGLTLVINLVMHNFWAPDEAHETQNFVKNLGIMAGLLAIAGLGAGPFSLDNRKKG